MKVEALGKLEKWMALKWTSTVTSREVSGYYHGYNPLTMGISLRSVCVCVCVF